MKQDEDKSIGKSVMGLVSSSAPYLIRLAIGDINAFCHLGAFLGKKELISFFFINKTIFSMLPPIIAQHYKYAYITSDEKTLLHEDISNKSRVLQKKFKTSPQDRVTELLADGLESSLFDGIYNNKNKELLDLLLLLKGTLIDVNIKLVGIPLIVHVVENGRTKLLKNLLEKKAEIHSIEGIDQEKDLINFAFKHEQFEIIQLLESQSGSSSIPVMKKSKNGYTLLMLAVNSGHTQYVKKILKTRQKEINFSHGNVHPLTIALKNQNLELLQLLFEHGAKMEAKLEEEDSLLNLFIGYFPFQVIDLKPGKMPERNINRIKQIFGLLLSQGEKVDKIKPYILSTLFKNDDYALIKEIILLGFGHSEIGMFEIVNKLNDILQNSKDTNDRDLLEFWLNVLKEKLPVSADGLYSILATLPRQMIQLLNPPEDSLEYFVEKFFEKASQTPLEMKEDREWHEIEARIKILFEIGEDLRISYTLNPSNNLLQHRSSDESSIRESESKKVPQNSNPFILLPYPESASSSASTSSSQSNSESHSASGNNSNKENILLYGILFSRLSCMKMDYLGSYLLNSFIRNKDALCLIGSFLNTEELTQTIYINKYFFSIFSQLISQHYLWTYKTREEEKLISKEQLTQKDLFEKLRTLSPLKRVEELFGSWLELNLLFSIQKKKKLTIFGFY